VPVIAATTGNGFTVRIAVALILHPKPLVTVYDIVAFPADTPVTIPDVPTVAIAGAELLHTPLAVILLKVVVASSHTDNVPVIAATVGLGFTVTTTVAVVLHPKPFVTV
jgi:hypothetical protein